MASDAAIVLTRVYSAHWYPREALEHAKTLFGGDLKINLEDAEGGVLVRVSGENEDEVRRAFHDFGNVALSRACRRPRA